MSKENLIPIDQLCTHYHVEMSFFNSLMEFDLIEITTIKQTHYLHTDSINELEKIIRLHQDLYINLEGIDTVLNLLDKIDVLQTELSVIKNRLGLYEN
jgi:chaperone modulatory protein CbpM